MGRKGEERRRREREGGREGVGGGHGVEGPVGAVPVGSGPGKSGAVPSGEEAPVGDGLGVYDTSMNTAMSV